MTKYIWIFMSTFYRVSSGQNVHNTSLNTECLSFCCPHTMPIWQQNWFIMVYLDVISFHPPSGCLQVTHSNSTGATSITLSSFLWLYLWVLRLCPRPASSTPVAPHPLHLTSLPFQSRCLHAEMFPLRSPTIQVTQIVSYPGTQGDWLAVSVALPGWLIYLWHVYTIHCLWTHFKSNRPVSWHCSYSAHAGASHFTVLHGP